MNPMEESLVKKGIIGLGGSAAKTFGRVALDIALNPVALDGEEDTPEGYARGEEKRATEKEKTRLEGEEEARRLPG